MDKNAIKKTIAEGRAVLGIELGSTRIKAVLIGEDHAPVASGSFGWENRLENGVWTYALADVWAGVQAAYRDLADDPAVIDDQAGSGVQGLCPVTRERCRPFAS